MDLQIALNLVPVYVLVLFRIAGMMIWAPLLGSDRIPRRIKSLIACVMAAAIAPTVHTHLQMPATYWGLAVALGGEILMGAAIGMILSFIFVAAQWAGEMIGQQMGLNLGQTLDPQFGGGGSMVGQVYFFLTLVVFLSIDGHRAMILGVRDSFTTLPLLTAGVNADLIHTIINMFQSATLLALQLSAPMLVTMLVVDLVLGFVGKTVPQLNIMTAGIPLRALVGMVVLLVGLSLASSVIREALMHSMKIVYSQYAHVG